MYPDFFPSLADCTDGDVLLMDGHTPSINQSEGRVEVCYDNQYWTVCDDFWDVADASIICWQLGFTGTGTDMLLVLYAWLKAVYMDSLGHMHTIQGLHVLPRNFYDLICRNFAEHFPIMRAGGRYGSGHGQILFDDLMCSGTELSLFDCPRNNIWENNCASDHSEDAGVVCNSKTWQNCA